MKKGFTLSEVLITLGIIGIVAAMTLPSLISKCRSKVISVQLKKMYSVISQAMLLAMPDGDYYNLSFTPGGGTDSAEDFFNNYLKPHIKTMNVNITSGAATTFKKYNKKNNSIDCGSGVVEFYTPDGYQFCIDTWSSRDADTVGKTFGVETEMEAISGGSSIVVVGADVNGEKNPNTLGRDVFFYVLTKKGLLPAGYSKTDEEIDTECRNTGYYCFTKIMRNNWEFPQEDVF